MKKFNQLAKEKKKKKKLLKFFFSSIKTKEAIVFPKKNNFFSAENQLGAKRVNTIKELECIYDDEPPPIPLQLG